MGFMSYSLECLGGRAQWMPFQHLIENIIQNQLYIYRNQDRRNINKQDFDVIEYEVDVGNKIIETDEELKKSKLITLDYEQILADIECGEYAATYQFSLQSMEALRQMLINTPEIDIPPQNLMKYILRKAKIKLSTVSFGSCDLLSLCNLYRASFKKINIDFSAVGGEFIEGLIHNVDNSNNDMIAEIQRTFTDKQIKKNWI